MPCTKKYCWSLSDHLGSGAVGDVYTGYNVESGDRVAVKVMKNFTGNELTRLISLQERELEVLKRLNHPNIVKLLDVELEPGQESNQGRKIIVMELCTGGSLYNLISSPENIFGIDDKEFLNVLEGIALGMEKLHEENIIHRDIKPGNIMRFIGEDGRTTYKLIDFGAARELHPEQKFESIHGTEEYLHPGMYEKAFIDSHPEQFFEHSVDLWSIGATLYHVAAGQIPFQSFIGRKDRSTMYEIIANKKSGDISGIQEVKNGRIVYDQHLPANCIMSRGLRPHVEQMLARLLEMDKERIMSFDEFFRTAKGIIAKQVVSVFQCDTTDILKVYMDPTCTFKKFRELVEEQTRVEPDRQMLLYENLDFSTQFEDGSCVVSCGEIADRNPVYLYSFPDLDRKLTTDDTKYSIPEKPKNSKEFLNFSRYCCESVHFIRRNVARCILRQKLMNTGAIMLIRFLSRRFDKSFVKVQHLTESCQLHQRRIEGVEVVLSLLAKSEGAPFEQVQGKARNSLKRQKDLHSEVAAEVGSLRKNSKEMEAGLQSAVQLWVEEKPFCKEEECCLPRIEVIVTKVSCLQEEMAKKLADDHSSLKCQKLSTFCTTAKSQIETHCQVNTKQLIEAFRQFLSAAWSQKERLDALEKALNDQYERQTLLLESMDESSLRLKQSLKIPALDLDLPTSPGASDMTVREGKLFVRRRESMENKYARQLYSLSGAVDGNATVANLIPLAEENNRMIDGLMKKLQKNLGAHKPNGGAKGQMTTFQRKSQPPMQDKTLTRTS